MGRKKGVPHKGSKTHAIVERYMVLRNLRQVAAEFGVSHQCVGAALKRMGVDSSPASKDTNASRVSDQLIARAMELRSVPKAAAEFNVSKDSAYWMLKKRGVTIRHRNPVDRFWAKVNITSGEDCWLWNAAVDRNGYGRASWVKANGIERYQQSWYAHRLAWYLTYNFVPDSPLEILHKCGIALCCNPDHLRVGTKAENLADRSFHRKVGHGPHVLEYYNNNILYKSP